jgi:hypothetical protein
MDLEQAADPGAVFLSLSEGSTARTVRRLANTAIPLCAPGRLLVAYWPEPVSWGRRTPVEAILTQTVLGPPESRMRDAWSLFGNGVCRTYADLEPGKLRIVRSVHWVAFQAPGERALRRRPHVDPSLRDGSTLPVTHPAFTRDVANNVWHLPDEVWEVGLVQRFAALLAWSDESSVTVSEEGIRHTPWSPLDLGASLIPRAEKRRYEWRDAPTLF